MTVERIETTIGDLVCAICDACEEVTANTNDILELSHAVLMDLLQTSDRQISAQ